MIKRSSYTIAFLCGSIICNSQTWGKVLNSAKDAAVINKTEGLLGGTTTPAAPSLTNDEVIKGLKEALTVGTNNSSGMASKADGYLKNPKLFIPWPAEAQDMRAKLIKMGMQKKVT